MPAARGGLAIRTADQPQPQLFNVYVTSKHCKPALSVVACWPSGSALRVSTTAVHRHFNCSHPSVLRDGRILHVSTEPSMNHKRWLSKTRPRTWGECKSGALVFYAGGVLASPAVGGAVHTMKRERVTAPWLRPANTHASTRCIKKRRS